VFDFKGVRRTIRLSEIQIQSKLEMCVDEEERRDLEWRIRECDKEFRRPEREKVQLERERELQRRKTILQWQLEECEDEEKKRDLERRIKECDEELGRLGRVWAQSERQQGQRERQRELQVCPHMLLTSV
jgi:hypothetical protein